MDTGAGYILTSRGSQSFTVTDSHGSVVYSETGDSTFQEHVKDGEDKQIKSQSS